MIAEKRWTLLELIALHGQLCTYIPFIDFYRYNRSRPLCKHSLSLSYYLFYLSPHSLSLTHTFSPIVALSPSNSSFRYPLYLSFSHTYSLFYILFYSILLSLSLYLSIYLSIFFSYILSLSLSLSYHLFYSLSHTHIISLLYILSALSCTIYSTLTLFISIDIHESVP